MMRIPTTTLKALTSIPTTTLKALTSIATLPWRATLGMTTAMLACLFLLLATLIVVPVAAVGLACLVGVP